MRRRAPGIRRLARRASDQTGSSVEDFDQSFYFSIAHDLERYGVYSNGVFGSPGTEAAPPKPGMFFMPLYPLVIWGAMQIDKRFEAVISCANNLRYDRAEYKRCPPYSFPVMVLHAVMLAVGAFAVAMAGALILKTPGAFYVTLAVATIGLYSHAGIFSYMMTESLTFCLYSLCILAFILAMDRHQTAYFSLTGFSLGLLVLTRPSFFALLPVFVVILCVRRWLADNEIRLCQGMALMLACALTISPWFIRNVVSVGKFGMTEEYGAGIIIERLGYNKMTLTEGLLAFPACIPQIGNDIVSKVFGERVMNRWGWSGSNTFFGSGTERRAALMAQGRLDPVIGKILTVDLRDNWWRHALTSIPIAWCGLWVGHLWGLIFIPIFMAGTAIAVRRRNSLYFAYLFPALGMGLVHGLLANHAVRFNIGFIGPIAVGVAYVALDLWTRYDNRRVQRSPATAP
jgi:hypothetical protein